MLDRKRSPWLIVACITCLGGNAGCHLFRASAPRIPQTQSHTPAQTTSTPPINERVVCVETARSVAEAGHVREAILLYEKAEGLGDEPSLHRQLAPLYAQQGQLDKAFERYQWALAETPNDTELLNNLAWTQLENGRVVEARQTAEQGLRVMPTHPRLQSTLAMVHFREGNAEAAFDLFEQAYGSAAAHHNLALLSIEVGDHRAAQRHLDEAAQQGHFPETAQLKAAFDATLASSNARNVQRP